MNLQSNHLQYIMSHFKVVRKYDNYVLAHCPSHEDRTPSLIISCYRGAKRGLHFNCKSGCSPQQICESVGIKMTDKYEKELDSWVDIERKIEAIYPYRDEKGNIVYEVVRYHPKDFRQRRTVNGEYQWKLGSIKRYPYNLPDIIRTNGTDIPVVIVEGEKDAELLRKLGMVATTSVGGAGSWLTEYSIYLKGRRVVVIPDGDEPGMKHAIQVCGSLLWHKAKSVILCNMKERMGSFGSDIKDVSDFFKGGERDRERLCEFYRMVKSCPEWRME